MDILGICFFRPLQSGSGPDDLLHPICCSRRGPTDVTDSIGGSCSWKNSGRGSRFFPGQDQLPPMLSRFYPREDQLLPHDLDDLDDGILQRPVRPLSPFSSRRPRGLPRQPLDILIDLQLEIRMLPSQRILLNRRCHDLSIPPQPIRREPQYWLTLMRGKKNVGTQLVAPLSPTRCVSVLHSLPPYPNSLHPYIPQLVECCKDFPRNSLSVVRISLRTELSHSLRYE